jgi:ectoine hydroxylase-related dioxygenase (phytanoyl-CoA dioxygenase family)
MTQIRKSAILRVMERSVKREFSENGFAIIRNLFDVHLVSKVRNEIKRVHQDFLVLKERAPQLHKLGEWSIKSPHIVSQPIKNIIHSESFQNLCLELIGKDVDLFWSATADKPKEKGKKFPWHQDTGYDENPKDYITIWTAFDRVDESNGGLWAVPGSHFGEIYSHEFRRADESNYAGVFIKGQCHFDEDALPIRLLPGDALCMHSKLIHASFQNHTLRERTGLIAAFIKSLDYSVPNVRGAPELTEPFLKAGKIVFT